jgi:DNA repair protein RecN (Recombination protein N)
MRQSYLEWSEAHGRLEQLKKADESSAHKRDELIQITEEIGSLPHLKAGRRRELEAEIKRIGNSERLILTGQKTLQLLSGEDGLTSSLKEVSSALGEMARLDPSTEKIARDFESVRESLANSEFAVTRYVDGLDLDAGSLEQLREELSELARLERKYRVDDAGLAEYLVKAQSELQRLGAGSNISALEKEAAELFAVVQKRGKELRVARQKAAKQLEVAVSKDLAELAMGDASLEVRFGHIEPTAHGIDRVEFAISTNKGEPVGSLAQIASGGELSRVMLVLKKILREQSGVNVLIFDEVDAGISGGVARSVGRMLKAISSQSQVLCITHLPQVASLSDKHFLVQKEVGERTLTVVKALTDGEKVDEIARMLSGFKITDASRASARELIESR